MKPYRLKHKPSGLYYQPSKGGNNLSTKGKVYLTNVNGLSSQRDPMYISVMKDSIAHKKTKDILPWEKSGYKYGQLTCKVPHSDFEMEYLD